MDFDALGTATVGSTVASLAATWLTLAAAKRPRHGRKVLRPTGAFLKPVHVESLRVYEGPGKGHTLSRHVDNEPGADARRLAAEPDIAASGSFFSEAIAQRCVDQAVAEHGDAIRNWLRSKSRVPLARDVDMGEPVGSVLTRTEYNDALARGETPQASPVNGARLVLRRSKEFPGGFFVLTAYPVETSSATPSVRHNLAPLHMYEAPGTTLSRHVHVPSESLVDRLDREPSIDAASRFLDEATAQRAVERAVTARSADIANWLASTSRARFTATIDVDENIGEVLTRDAYERGSTRPVVVDRVHIVLVRSTAFPEGFYVKTAYPVLPW